MIYPEGNTPLVSDSRQRWLNKIVSMGGGASGGGGGGGFISEEGDPLVTEDGEPLIPEE